MVVEVPPFFDRRISTLRLRYFDLFRLRYFLPLCFPLFSNFVKIIWVMVVGYLSVGFFDCEDALVGFGVESELLEFFTDVVKLVLKFLNLRGLLRDLLISFPDLLFQFLIHLRVEGQILVELFVVVCQ